MGANPHYWNLNVILFWRSKQFSSGTLTCIEIVTVLLIIIINQIIVYVVHEIFETLSITMSTINTEPKDHQCTIEETNTCYPHLS